MSLFQLANDFQAFDDPSKHQSVAIEFRDRDLYELATRRDDLADSCRTDIEAERATEIASRFPDGVETDFTQRIRLSPIIRLATGNRELMQETKRKRQVSVKRLFLFLDQTH